MILDELIEFEESELIIKANELMIETKYLTKSNTTLSTGLDESIILKDNKEEESCKKWQKQIYPLSDLHKIAKKINAQKVCFSHSLNQNFIDYSTSQNSKFSIEYIKSEEIVQENNIYKSIILNKEELCKKWQKKIKAKQVYPLFVLKTQI